MENEREKKNIEQSVLTAIKSGRVKMRPRWQFVLRATLIAVGVIVMFLALLYLVSFILFVLHQTGAWFVPAFGPSGWFAFFHRLPWVLIGLAILFIIILEVLVRRYAFAYQRPLLASALSILGIVLIGGATISATRFHVGLFNSARHNGLPVIGGMYRGFGMSRFDDIHRGEIIQMAGNTFVIQDDDGDTSTILLTPETRLPFGDDFTASDTVIVFGVPGPDGTVRAFGIQKVVDQ